MTLSSDLKAHLSSRLRNLIHGPPEEGAGYRVLRHGAPVDVWKVAFELAGDDDEFGDDLYEALVSLGGPAIVHYKWYSDAPISWTDSVQTFNFDHERSYVVLSVNEDVGREYTAVAAIEPAGSKDGLEAVARELLIHGDYSEEPFFPSLGSLPTELWTIVPREQLPVITVQALDTHEAEGDPWPQLVRSYPDEGIDHPLSEDDKLRLARRFIADSLRSDQ